MSSILKALKKLENETSASSDIRPNLQQFQTKTAKSPAASGWYLKKRLFIILTTLILLVGIALTLTLEPWRKQSVPSKTSNLRAEAPSLPATETKSAVKQKPILNINDSQPHNPLGKAAENPSLAAQKGIKEEPKRLLKTATGANETGDVSEVKSAISQPVTTSPLHRENNQVSEKKTDNNQIAAIPIKQTSESLLELQAIAWSENPDKCMAVVNSHIVHVGDSVEGATVRSIGKNEIVFSKEGVVWRQLFKPSAN